MEYLHYLWRQGRGQKAEGKEEGCKVQGNNDCLGRHDITKSVAMIPINKAKQQLQDFIDAVSQSHEPIVITSGSSNAILSGLF